MQVYCIFFTTSKAWSRLVIVTVRCRIGGLILVILSNRKECPAPAWHTNRDITRLGGVTLHSICLIIAPE